jgi:hypothetical protein
MKRLAMYDCWTCELRKELDVDEWWKVLTCAYPISILSYALDDYEDKADMAQNIQSAISKETDTPKELA